MRTQFVLSCLLLAACYNPNFVSGQVECGPEGACPAGFQCRADKRCWLPDESPPGDDLSTMPPADLAGDGAPAPDMVTPASPFLRVQGGRIVDGAGRPVRITAVSWFGFESAGFAPQGLWVRRLGDVLDQIRTMGFNALRLPISNQLLDAGSRPTGLDANPDLMMLNGQGLLDRVISEAGRRGLRVILVRHQVSPAVGQTALWYTVAYPESRWISDWVALAQRYRDNPAVVAFDLHAEPYDPATWGTGSMMNDWKAAAERAGRAILMAHPELLIIVQGIQTLGPDGYWRGGNLMGARMNPVQLPAERLVYATSDYPSSVAMQSWFQAANYPDNLPGVWDKFWGFLAKEAEPARAPVMIAGFGVRTITGMGMNVMRDRQWLTKLTEYIGANQLSFAYWCLNPDTFYGGLLRADWTTVQTDKLDALRLQLAPLIPTP